MIKAVFFDWSNTLASYSPSREELQSQALREIGINVPPEKITPGIASADRYLFSETAISPVPQRSVAEQTRVYTRYQQILLTEVGASIPAGSAGFMKMMKKLNELYLKMRFVLFDDVLPSMKTLKTKGLVLALVTNMDTDMRPVCRELGLADYLDFIFTSGEVGSSKPQPKIFMTALQHAKVSASEAVHVGDQLDIDIAGARGAGIKPILLDRSDLFPEVTDCPRIHSLSELAQHLS